MSFAETADTIAEKAMELFALYAEIDALRKDFKDNPPKTAEEYASRLAQIARLAKTIAEVASSISSRSTGLSDAEIATVVAASHARNQSGWSDPKPVAEPFPYGEVLTFDPAGDDRLVVGDEIYRNRAGLAVQFIVVGNIGFKPDAPWQLVQTIGR